MIKFFMLFIPFLGFIVFTALPIAAHSEDTNTTISETTDEASKETDYEIRLKLARNMHEIWPIRPKVEAILENIAVQIPQQERLKFKAALRKAIKFDALEETSIDAMADIFTIKELEAMVDFYGSKEGRSVSFKTDDYERALQPILTKMMDKALLDIKLGTE